MRELLQPAFKWVSGVQLRPQVYTKTRVWVEFEIDRAKRA